ncbi:MAG: hypothetical protein IJQ08_05955 [Synergistaceae bacterium]|nr:hypothetical protein [Synergistaceae bacterium]
MKGVRFYAKDYNKYTSNKLLASANYRVEIPLYNASFQDANGVKVNLYWVTDKEQESSLSSKHFIGSDTINMSGWSADGTNEANNKAWARIDFTPIKTITEDGNYYLYAEIEFSGDEVHKNRSTQDPGGNNQGYFDFDVEGSDTAPKASNFRASTTISEDIEYVLSVVQFPKVRYNDKDSWVDFFNEYVKDKTGPFTMKVAITNEMEYKLPDVEFCSFFYDKDLWEGEHIPYTTTSYSKHFTLFPHKTYSFEVTVDAETADRIRAAGLGNVWCDLTYRPALLDVVYEAVYGHPYRGNIPDGDSDSDTADDSEVDPDNADSQENAEGTVYHSSSGGCEAGISVSGTVILLSALMVRRKAR